MEKHFDLAYQDAIDEELSSDQKYRNLCRISGHLQDEFRKMVSEESQILKMHEEIVAAIYNAEFRFIKLAYLKGAEDRERMLKV